MSYIYKTQGTCAKQITVELDGNIIKKVEFVGGCNGNLNGISSLVVGMPIEQVIERFSGTTCGPRNTSCPDQLSVALKEAFASSKTK
ncbi:TIGR03905 family TSCPD domain-containing protein [Anaerosinus massiliensis]|uniref:TIGR03905 family TSCPD domain-containing protein n=1 Tax=Massilibacillus massiliensis TaxID=1806837 RepID=UPI000A3F2E0A|nr:TIGR03905 family TSCPD domain-containing protein [Massilibacillus massiliensis]